MGNTPYYNLGYLEPGQDLSKNLDLDELRFKTIDNQLYAIFTLFKNGIIEDGSNNNISWRVSTYSDSNKFLKVSVSSGKGHVSFKAAETSISKDVLLPVLPVEVENVKIWIYAVQNSDTLITKDVDFIASITQITDTDNYINVGGVIVNQTQNTITVFEDERQVLSFYNSLSDIIYRHKHIGGSANPAPINLSSETTNKLSGENIENLNLATVSKGKLSASRLSKIDHNLLENVGALSHNQIESLLEQNISLDETYRLSDLSIANRLQALIALKKQSGFEYIDSTQLNTIVYVPGIWPNSNSNSSVGTTSNFKDTDVPANLTQAIVYDSSPYTSGNGISSSTSDLVFTDIKTYSTKNDFENAKIYNQNNNLGLYENIKISGSIGETEDGFFTLSTPLNFRSIEQPVDNIFDESSGWYKATHTSSNFSNGSVSVDTKLFSYKIFDNPIAMNETSNIGIGFSVGLGTTLSKIGQIYMYLILGTDVDPKFNDDIKITFDSGQYFPSTSTSTLYLSSTDGTEIGYKIFDDLTESSSIGSSIYKNIILDDLWPSEYRTSIKGLGFYWSSSKGWNPEKSISFHLRTPNDDQVNPIPYNYDDLQAARKSSASNSSSSIFIYNETLFAPSGNFLIRFDSGFENTVYNLLQWDGEEPNNTELSITSRTDINSSTFYELSNIDKTTSLSSGTFNVLSNQGRYIDVLFNFSSDPSNVHSPKIKEFKLHYTTVGTGNTKTFNSKYSDFTAGQTGWFTENYYSKNIGYGSTYTEDGKNKNKMFIANTSTIGNWIYLKNNSAVSADLENNESTYEDGVSSLNLTNYLTPVQIYEKSSNVGFKTPKDYIELEDGSNIYCDTLNDRILHFDLDGSIKRLIQGNIRLNQKERDFVALGAYFNPNVRKIWIALSQNISLDSPYDPTKIYIVYDNSTIRLDDARIDQNNTGLYEPISGKSATLEITFENTNIGKALVESISSARNKYVRIEKGAFTNGGFSENTVGISTSVITNNLQKTLNSLTYFTYLSDSNYSGTLTTSTGVPFTITPVIEDLDFNDDSVVPTVNILGPADQIDDITIDMYEGPIYFRNIYNPISVNYSLNKIIIAQPAVKSIVAYNDDEDLTTKYSVPYEVAPFIDSKLGSVYEISEGLLLIGLPGVNNNNGTLLKYRVSGGLSEVKLVFENLDVVKAVPGPNIDTFYVLFDDVLNSGVDSRLKLINSTGNIISTWGENLEIIHPKGLRVVSNNDILVSE